MDYTGFLKNKINRRLAMNKWVFVLTLVIFTVAVNVSRSHAGWLIYHKPAFQGKVIDAETKEPIEGAVVVVVYKKHTLISGPGGGYTTEIKTKETLTDQKGEFHFSSYTTVIQPNSIEDYAEFIIYKPGYGNFPGQRRSPPMGMGLEDIETFFSREIGTQEKLEVAAKTADDKFEEKLVNMTLGVVELPLLKTRDERLRAMPSTPTDIRSKELPLLYKMMNEENKRFGLGEEK